MKSLEHRNAPRFDDAGFRPWFYRVVHNQAIDWLRSRRKFSTLDQLPEEASEAGNPEAQLDVDRRKLLLHKALGRLDGLQREIICLKDFHDFSYDDIAVLLSGYLDGELTQQQAQHVRLHIDGCVHCRQIHDDLGRLKVQMQHLSWPQSDEDMLDAIGNDLTARTAAVLGWSLMLVALLVVIGCLVAAFFSAPDDMFLLLAFYGLLILGGLGLFISVLRQRLMIYKNDRYRKVKL